VSIRSVSKNYGKTKVLSDFSLDLYRGEILCLLGANGSGKTTLINILTGRTKADSGEIKIINLKTGRLVRNAALQASMISFCPQENILVPDLTVKEHLELFADLKNLKEKATLLGEKAKATSITDLLDLKVSILSEGQKRKVSICMALLGEA
jgi:ABC-type multidrug transport system ATPase subunit